MNLFSLENWPLLVVCIGMIWCAVIDGWKRKVPNYLTFPLIFSGWLLGLLHDCGVQLDAGQGGFGAAFAGTWMGFALLLPLLLIKGVGVGDVKMQMGFGSWVGAFYGLRSGAELGGHQGEAIGVIFWAWVYGVLVGGIIGICMIIYLKSLKHNLKNVREIMLNMATSVSSGQLSKIPEKGEEIRAREPKLPYGVPLCIGFVGYLIYLHHF